MLAGSQRMWGSQQTLRTAGGHHGLHLEGMTSCKKNPTSSIDVYLLEKQSCQISSGSNLKRQSLGFFIVKHMHCNKYKNGITY